MAFLKIDNYCENDLKIQNGVPITTKDNPSEHGYGIRSIQSVVQRYDGEFEISIVDHVFTLAIIFPIPMGFLQ